MIFQFQCTESDTVTKYLETETFSGHWQYNVWYYIELSPDHRRVNSGCLEPISSKTYLKNQAESIIYCHNLV